MYKRQDLQWNRQQLFFTAVDTTTTLTFSSPQNGVGFWGPVLDDVSVTASELISGDGNRDGIVNFSDIPPFISILFTGGFQPEADVNLDGVVNFLDISPFIALLSDN